MYKNAWLMFIMHMMVEIICFTLLAMLKHIGLIEAALISMLFDIVAFCPQFIFGIIHEKYKKLDLGTTGVVLMLLSIIIANPNKDSIINTFAIILVAIGNAILHECGAIQTTLLSKAKLFPSALFVGGGSFGVVIGQTLGNLGISKWWLLVPIIICVLTIITTNKDWLNNDEYPIFNIVVSKVPVMTIIIVAFTVTLTRSYIGYAIPISWKKELWQSFLLFFTMGIGKAFGGFVADKIGAYKTALITTLGSIPFLIAGENLMIVSIIGIFLFSMTMSITFGMLLSIIGKNPGLAFGITTVALACGVLPVFFIKLSTMTNIIVIIFASLMCAFLLSKTLRKG